MDLSSQSQQNKNTAVPTEGILTKSIERQTAKVPSTAYLGLAGGAMAASIGLILFSKNKNVANFVGLWVPTFLMLGIYNKIVKTRGSDQKDNAASMH